jgi:Trypsin-like serine proteases, typically periplasmic, contain C-terminal PDZ domain
MLSYLQKILSVSSYASIATLTFALSLNAIAQTPANDPRTSDRFAEIAERVEPAVVSIDTKGRTPEITTRGEATPGQPDDIMEFFRRQMPRRAQASVGSGFIVDKSGYVITNAHVVDDAIRITVKLDSGEELPATVVGADKETDIAVLKINAGKDLPFVSLGDSDKARVGEWVLALGSPFGLSRSVTAGIISHKQRETGGSVFQKFIQTDAAINRGNSGGPLVNLSGEVIGVNSQIATSTGDYNGVGFALPSNETKYVYSQLLEHGKVRRGFLGVLLDTVKPEFAKVYGMGETRGAIITDVRASVGPAEAAGLLTGDIITEFDGKPVVSAQDLIGKVGAASPDRSIALKVLREEGTALVAKTISLKLGERPVDSVSLPDDPSRTKLPLDGVKPQAKPFGLTLVELTPQMAETYKLAGQKGLVVKEISPDSELVDVKSSTGGEALGEGDVIQRINRVSVADQAAFAAAAGKLRKGDPVVLHVAVFDPRSKTSQLKIVQFTVQ